MTEKKAHHWSGWPGAYCLHCGQSDLWEIAIGRGLYDPYSETWVEGEEESKEIQKLIKENDECPVGYSEHCGQCKFTPTAMEERADDNSSPR